MIHWFRSHRCQKQEQNTFTPTRLLWNLLHTMQVSCNTDCKFTEWGYFVIKKPSSVLALPELWDTSITPTLTLKSSGIKSFIMMVSGVKICKKYLRIDEADQKDDLWSLFLSHIQSLLLMKPCTTFCSDHLINKQTWIAKQRHFSSGSYQKLRNCYCYVFFQPDFMTISTIHDINW